MSDYSNPSEGRSTDIELLYADHHAWLITRIAKRVGCTDCAADITQSTFLKLLCGKSEPIRNPKALIATIARGLMVDHLRKRDLERAWAEAIGQVSEMAAPSSEDCVVVLDMITRIDCMLDGLGARAKRVFLLSRLEGLTYCEIATELRTSLSTVEKEMAIAIRHCRGWHERTQWMDL